MIIVGITGGIGSGKTTIAKHLNALGVPLYVADDEAKALMNRSKVIRRKLTAIFGENAYKNNKLNRTFLAKKIFADKSLLAKMNAIVHPKVASHFKRWLKKQKAPYILKEAAIIFENGLQDNYDYIITVVADKDLRIERLLKRDNLNKEKILAIINNQWPDSKKMEQSDFVITNNNLNSALLDAEKIHQKILKLSSK